MTCEYCAEKSPIFELHCFGCRDRIVMAEDCKFLREQTAKFIDEKFGFLPDYKRTPHCGCEKFCKRKAAVKDEQQVNPEPTQASRRR